MPQPMGLGPLGGQNLIFKRKFRWTFGVQNVCGGAIPESFVKRAARPTLTTEETEVNYLNAVDWIPGKSKWETITVSYYDVATIDNQYLWNWLASVYNFTDPINLQQGSNRASYAGTGMLTLFSGCGDGLERWVLNNCWPATINFGELDYEDSGFAEVELTLRYSQVQFTSLCPNFTPQPCCNPCTGTT